MGFKAPPAGAAPLRCSLLLASMLAAALFVAHHDSLSRFFSSDYHPLPCEARRAGGGWSAAACVDCARYAAPKDVARHRVFFMHLQKCGGTTLNIQLKELAEKLGLTWQRHVRACNASINVGHRITFPLLQECSVDMLQSIAFTVLREPLPRILSNYRYLQDDRRAEIRSLTDHFGAYMARQPKSLLLLLGTSNILTMKRRLLELDVVGITERPAETFAAVYYLLGAAADVPGSIVRRNVQLGPKAPLVGERDVAALPEPRKAPITAREAALLLAENAHEVELYAFAREVFASQLACMASQPLFSDRLARFRAAYDASSAAIGAHGRGRVGVSG